MAIRSIRLQHFRSYTDAYFELTGGVNMVVGPNGSGKTNLLEALYVLARGKSFRVADAELLQYGAEWFRLDADIDGQTRTLRVKKNESKLEKRLVLGGQSKSRLSARERLRVVLFEPRDMQLLTGSPERRREYLDDIIDQLVLGYGRVLTHYRRSLTQRNVLLKQPREMPADHFFVWNVRLSELGAQMTIARRRLAAALQTDASALYQSISGTNAKVGVVYQEQFHEAAEDQLASALLGGLEKNYHKDRERGFTSVGPHRDDFELVLNGAPASTSASRGETRSLVVMLKLLEAKRLDSQFDTPSLMLLDDVFGELDASRRHALADHFQDHQVIITTTDAEALGAQHNLITFGDDMRIAS